MKGLLDKSGGEIIGFTKMFPLEPALENFTKFLTESQKNIEAYYPQIDQLDFYRYFCKLFFWDVIEDSFGKHCPGIKVIFKSAKYLYNIVQNVFEKI